MRSTASCSAGMLFSYESCRTVDAMWLPSLLECHSARKQNVVFQMNMLVKIGFENGQGLVQGLVADTDVARRRVAVRGLAQCPQSIPCRIMFMFHHRNRILDRAERRTRNWSISFRSSFHPEDVGE